jgi:hypothetical protein
MERLAGWIPSSPTAKVTRVRDFHGKILRALSTGNISTGNFPENWKWKYFHFFHWKSGKVEKAGNISTSFWRAGFKTLDAARGDYPC